MGSWVWVGYNLLGFRCLGKLGVCWVWVRATNSATNDLSAVARKACLQHTLYPITPGKYDIHVISRTQPVCPMSRLGSACLREVMVELRMLVLIRHLTASLPGYWCIDIRPKSYRSGIRCQHVADMSRHVANVAKLTQHAPNPKTRDEF